MLYLYYDVWFNSSSADYCQSIALAVVGYTRGKEDGRAPRALKFRSTKIIDVFLNCTQVITDTPL